MARSPLSLPAGRDVPIGAGIAAIARDSGSAFIFADAMRRDWVLAEAELEGARAALRDIRDFTERCNAAYGPDGRVDEAEAAALGAKVPARFADY